MVTLKFHSVAAPVLPSDLPKQWTDNITTTNGTGGGVDVEINVIEDDSSYRYRAIMEKPTLTLKFSLPYWIDFPIGTTCEYQTQTFILNTAANIKKQNTRNIEYTLTMGTEQDNLGNFKFRNSVDKRLKWSMCAKPHEFIDEIVANLNERLGANKWSRGACLDATEKTIEFNHVYIDEALQMVADEFETEWEIVGTTIRLGKVEYNKDNPLPLSYGKGNGFVPGVGRTTQSDEQPIKRLYAQGGDRNINRSEYGSGNLLLPKSQTLEYEGRIYTSDVDGYYIERTDEVSDAVKEDSLDCSEIYPSRIGKVTSVEWANHDKNFLDFIDNTIPDDLNFNDYIIPGESMTIIFQSGMLAGKEFDVKYIHTKKDESGAVVAERRWQIVPQEIDGVVMPNDTFKPTSQAENTDNPDTYAVFGIMLPEAYICNNTDQSGASWDMFREAARYLYEHEEQKFTFTGELQGLWAKKNWENVGGYLNVGYHILFSDTQFCPNGKTIRITAIKDYTTAPHAPIIELSDNVSGSVVGSQIKEIPGIEVAISDTKNDILNFTRRRFRDAQETITMLEDALLENFTNSVNPIAVQTMAMLVGDESLQFRFVDDNVTPHVVTPNFTYDKAAKQLSVTGVLYVQHLTLGIDTISSSHQTSEYRFWEISPFTSAVLDNPDTKYYLYIKAESVNKALPEAEFMLSATAKKMDEEADYYYFLVGVLNSEYDGERSFVPLYGFTEVLPGRITTDRIVSGEGSSYFDMAANAMRLGDKLDFNSRGDGKLRIKGTIVQNEGGDESYVGCYRGEYNSAYTYYEGDEVWYTYNGSTATYRYINPTPSSGHAPTDTNYWQIVAAGKQGDKGDQGTRAQFQSTVFLRSNFTPDTPTGGTYESPVPTSVPYFPNGTLQRWYDAIPAGEEILWATTRIFSDEEETTWSTPRQMTDTATYDVEFSDVDQNPGTPTTDPDNWFDPVDDKDTKDFTTMLWRAERQKKNGTWDNWTIVRIKGEQGDKGDKGNQGDKGDQGTAGTYTEVRFAKGGSTTIAPSIEYTNPEPTGWTLTTPLCKTGEYLWQTMAQKIADGSAFVEGCQWSTPIRITPYDGADGENGAKGDSPVMVFRGTYDSSKTYYGNSTRLDCVKSGDEYYIARIDAGTFSAVAPTDTSKWNAFGASFESIATNLLLAEGANIGDWFISDGKIVSTLGSDIGKVILDAVNKHIRISTPTPSNQGYQAEALPNVTIDLDADAGIISAQATEKNADGSTKSSGISYITPTGIFANRAGMQCLPSTNGADWRAAIVGLGNGSLDKSDTEPTLDTTLVTGVYGRATNSGTAPSYGGYFETLKAKGLVLGIKYIQSSGVYLTDADTLVVGLDSATDTVYLPKATREGQIVFLKQWWTGEMRVYPQSGQTLYDDNTSNAYIQIPCGTMAIAVFVRTAQYGETWLFNKFSY